MKEALPCTSAPALAVATCININNINSGGAVALRGVLTQSLGEVALNSARVHEPILSRALRRSRGFERN